MGVSQSRTGTVPIKQPGGGPEVPPALADAFSHDEDPGIAGHLLAERLERGLHEADLAYLAIKLRGTVERRLGAGRLVVHESGGRCGLGPGRILGELLRVVDDGRDLGIERRQLGRFHQPLVLEQATQVENGASLFPCLDLFPRAVRVIAHSFRVRPGAVSPALQKCGPSSVASTPDRFSGRLVDGQDVVAVDLEPGHAVGRAPRGDTGTGRGVGEWDFGGELVVLAHEQDRQLPDPGHVQTFVKRPVVDRAVAEEGDRHLVGLRQLETVAGPRGLKDARPHDPAGSHQSDLGVKTDASIPRGPANSPSRGRRAPRIVPGRDPFRQSVPVPAMSAEDHVVGSQVSDHPRGNSLLAHVCVTGAMDQALLVCPGKLLLAAADQEHHLQETQKLFPLQRRRHHPRDPPAPHRNPGGRTPTDRPSSEDRARREW